MALTDKLTTIANAIRSKTGKSDALTLDQMATEIESISAGGSTEEWIGDGNTHIWITLGEGRTSPMLGCCPNGTVTVDWGDGTTPDTLTGTSLTTVRWTPNHNYAKAGDYVITLTVDGEMGLKGGSSSNEGSCLLRCAFNNDTRNRAYQNAVQKLEIGTGVTAIWEYAFRYFNSLTSVRIPDSVTTISKYAFGECSSLSSVSISGSVTTIREYTFEECNSLTSIRIPDSVTTISNNAFRECSSLSSVSIPDSVTTIGEYCFCKCNSLKSIRIPDSATTIEPRVFYECGSLSSVSIPDSVTTIGEYAFSYCGSVKFFDFTHHTAVPTLSNTNAFSYTPSDCEIRVPAALYDEWIAATNWSTYASQIVAV